MAKIRLTESQLHKIIKKCINEAQNVDFYEFVDLLERNGWAYSNYYEVSNKSGQTGIRYELEKYPNNLDGVKPVSVEELEQDLKNTFGDGVIISKGHYRYAPEIKNISVIILD